MKNTAHMQETQEHRDIAFFKLQRTLQSNLFRLRTVEEVIKEILGMGLKLPEGKTPDNALQAIFIYTAETGYEVIINSGVLNGRFINSGLPSILIRDKNKKRLFYREFHRTTFERVFEKLIVYAKYCKSIADNKPKGMELLEDRKGLGEMCYQWVRANGKKTLFNVRDYIKELTKEDCAFVLKNESSRKSYYKTSKGKVKFRKRDRKKTW